MIMKWQHISHRELRISGGVCACGVNVEFPHYGIHEAKGIERFGRAGPHTVKVTTGRLSPAILGKKC